MAEPTNPSVYVNIRIEGKTATIFNNTVETKGRNVTPTGGTAHPADGTNGNEYPFKVATCTAALASAAAATPVFTWNATWSPSFDDFFITRIKEEPPTPNPDREYWQLALNFKRATLGGGQLRIQTGDSVVWALIKPQQAPANGLALLKLKGPRAATHNVEFIVTVTDGETGKAVEGATITPGTEKTDYQGQAKITRSSNTNPYKLKAEHQDKYVRSNVLSVTVT